MLFMDEDEGENFNLHKRIIKNLKMILLFFFLQGKGFPAQ
jgi:hypothetical protein